MSFLLNNKKIELNNMTDINCNIEEMDLSQLSKTELLAKCEEFGFTKCKSKNKNQLIEMINCKNVIKPTKKRIYAESNSIRNIFIYQFVVAAIVYKFKLSE